MTSLWLALGVAYVWSGFTLFIALRDKHNPGEDRVGIFLGCMVGWPLYPFVYLLN